MMSSEFIHKIIDVDLVGLILLSISGFLLSIMRLNEPIFKKYFFCLLFNKFQKPMLLERLVSTKNQMAIQTTGESVLQSQDIQNIEINIFKAEQESELSLRMPTSTITSHRQSSLIYQSQELMIAKILDLASQIYCSENQLIFDPSSRKTIFRPYTFSFLSHFVFQPNYKDSEIKKIIKEANLNTNVLTILFIEQIYDLKKKSSQNSVEVFTYGMQVLEFLALECFNLRLEQVSQSMKIMGNVDSLQKMKLNSSSQQSGTIFTTSDGMISLDLISTYQKLQLTKGGGLLELWKRWDAESQESSGTLLPIVIGLMSFKINPATPLINILIRINRTGISYPLLREDWKGRDTIDQLIKHRIIGWISLKQNLLIKRFLATQVQDQDYQISLKEKDYKLVNESKQDLIRIVTSDIQLLSQIGCGNFRLEFIYEKYDTSKLRSLAEHEENGEDNSQVQSQLTNNLWNEESLKQSDNILLSCKRLCPTLGQFELLTHLGCLKVFWHNPWNKPNHFSNEEILTISDKIREEIINHF